MNPLIRWFKNLRQTLTPAPGHSGGWRYLYIPARTQAGVNVDHDNALTLSPVWSCVRIISETVGMLPWHVYRPADFNGKKGNEVASENDIDWLLNMESNPETDAGTFRETLMAHVLTWGNGYAEIDRDAAGRVAWLWPITPDRVKPDRVNRTGRIVYDVNNGSGANTVLEKREMFHVHGLGYDGMQGYSVIAMAAQCIGMGLAVEQFGAGFFGNGTEPGGVLTHPGTLKDEAYKRLKESWSERHQGPANARKPAILEEGMKWERITIPPEEAQFLQTQKFTVAQVARWYGVPLHMLEEMDRATFNNIEQKFTEFVIRTIQPWATKLERAANIQLLGRQQRGRLYTKISLQALLRGDMQARAEFYTKLWNMGVFSIDEIRELEELNPVDGGEKRFVQLNMTTLERAGEQPEPAAQPTGGLNGTQRPTEPNQPENVH